MNLINRRAVIVQPKEPYLAWARQLDDVSPSIDEISPHHLTSIYLVEQSDDPDPEETLRRHYAAIFEEQLNSWHRAADAWPPRRTYAMFREWFDVQVLDMVFDLLRGPLLHDD